MGELLLFLKNEIGDDMYLCFIFVHLRKASIAGDV